MRHVPISVFVLALAMLAIRASAFTVNTSLDSVDTNVGDGLCRDVNTFCSLRAAIQEANALGAPRLITLQSTGTYQLRLQELDPADPDEDAAATGDLDVTAPLIIEAPSGTTRRIQVAFNELLGPPSDRIFHVLPGGDLTLRRISLEDGVASSASTSRGGAILNEGTLALVDCTLDGNVALEGGAIYNDGFLLVSDCTFSNNDALTDGGGPGEGGAIFSGAAADTFVAASTFTGNGAEGSGGAILGDAGSFLDLENSTLSGNAGPDALRFENPDQVTLRHLTIHGNVGTGIRADLPQSVPFEIISSIVSGSSGAECSFTGAVSPTRLTSLASDGSCGFAATGGFDSADPELGPLADNGGPTLTHLPAPTSLVVDHADFFECPLEDQRGTLRPDGDGLGGDCDIGAVELPEPGVALLGLAALLMVRALAPAHARRWCSGTGP